MVDLNRKVLRHSLRERLSHWLVALTFFMTALSGLAFFFADFAWLADILGTPQIARIVHPFSGIVMIAAFMVLFFTYWRDNIPKKEDFQWLFKVVDVLKGNEHHVADVGHYNMGQKLLFWTMLVALIILLVTGIIMWQPYFANEFSVPVRRVAIALHAVTAIAFILGIMVHMYMAFWVKGSITGMVEGKVSARWAKKHHPRWFRTQILPKLEAEEKAVQDADKQKA
ncbi:formate dehydrogenase subunit gamma [Cricetibacter osteomyelitidis]|uniref:Formate dehydrogenase subunit gamma n=1 Tax=Cricetibacter osteomyelitidis TaxID=1521931 RepID=A0A4R2T5Q2_9PAST|nr:formate dehydrogenase subunit gamma [Cricetibacter osteomyelitidis]TCP96891.1 formate dehydrogenase subunit gamma [Cricetibacter osteomyelitidis]